MTPSLSRRALVALAATGLCAGAFAQAEWAPTRPVRIIVPIVGSTNDVVARLVAPKLSEALGQPVVVENKPGAGGNIGADQVAKAPPDGHTLLVQYSGYQVGTPAVVRNLGWDPLKDLAPIALLMDAPQVLLAHPSVPARTLAELVAHAKANPGRLNYASSGNGSCSTSARSCWSSAPGSSWSTCPTRAPAR